MAKPIMTDQLIKLTRIELNGSLTKEELFNWIVDLSQEEFDEFCNQIISLYNFEETFEGALVSDEVDLLRPWLPVLPRVVFSVDITGSGYQKKYFYQFLSWVDNDQLKKMCEEIISLYSHAMENNNTYIISQVYPAVAGKVQHWRVHFNRTKQFADLPERIMHWRNFLYA